VILEIYRMLNSIDSNGILQSSIITELPIDKRIPELVSHTRSTCSHVGIYFSATTNFSYVLEYARKHPELNFGIAKYKFNIYNLPKELIAIYPVMLREFWVSLFANSSDYSSGKMIKNPYSGTESSMLSVLQPAQQSVSSWCSKSYQVILQCDGLKMEIIEDPEEYAKTCGSYCHKEVYSTLIKLVPRATRDSISAVCQRVISDLDASANKNRYLAKFLLEYQKHFAA